MDNLGLSSFFGGSGSTSQSDKDAYAKEYPNGPPLNSNSAAAKMQKLMDYMGKLENKYHCSGIC